jgi:valine--pyruvate aminotransferase
LFHAVPPLIEKTGPHEFKYRVDFDRLEITPDIAAICASRPTNPSGNVLTDDEIARLSDLAERHGIPLIIDNAYGAPFPGIIFDRCHAVLGPHACSPTACRKSACPAPAPAS